LRRYASHSLSAPRNCDGQMTSVSGAASAGVLLQNDTEKAAPISEWQSHVAIRNPPRERRADIPGQLCQGLELLALRIKIPRRRVARAARNYVNVVS
jgi:hypothetical protein